MRKLLILLLLSVPLASVPLAAQPVITGLSAISGPAAGGNSLEIRGSGFSFCVICSPPLPLPDVLIGGAPATIVSGEETSIIVIAPPHPPGTYDVVVSQSNGAFVAQNAYTYTGNIEDGLERVLLPLFTQTVHGAFGSEFHTSLRLFNDNQVPAAIFGVQPECRVISGCIVFDPAERPYIINPHTGPRDFAPSGTPGRFLYVDKALASKILANLRVFDVTRSAQNFGTEIPVVRDAEMIRGPIKLLGVPLDARFRKTLRIYLTESSSVGVRIGDVDHLLEPTQPASPFEPAYIEFADFPVGTGTVDVEIVLPQILIHPPPPYPPVWAMVSVTNNDTQLITTITPQPVRTDPAGSGSN